MTTTTKVIAVTAPADHRVCRVTQPVSGLRCTLLPDCHKNDGRHSHWCPTCKVETTWSDEPSEAEMSFVKGRAGGKSSVSPDDLDTALNAVQAVLDHLQMMYEPGPQCHTPSRMAWALTETAMEGFVKIRAALMQDSTTPAPSALPNIPVNVPMPPVKPPATSICGERHVAKWKNGEIALSVICAKPAGHSGSHYGESLSGASATWGESAPSAAVALPEEVEAERSLRELASLASGFANDAKHNDTRIKFLKKIDVHVATLRAALSQRPASADVEIEALRTRVVALREAVEFFEGGVDDFWITTVPEQLKSLNNRIGRTDDGKWINPLPQAAAKGERKVPVTAIKTALECLKQKIQKLYNSSFVNTAAIDRYEQDAGEIDRWLDGERGAD